MPGLKTHRCRRCFFVFGLRVEIGGVFRDELVTRQSYIRRYRFRWDGVSTGSALSLFSRSRRRHW